MNTFERYSEDDGGIVKYGVKGLQVGANLPPIDNHFHWCRSTITYQIEKVEETRQILEHQETNYTKEQHPKPRYLGKTRISQVEKKLKEYENIIKDAKIENAIVITKDGEVYQCYGNATNVWVDIDLGDKLNEAYVTHNHISTETNYSFSSDDRNLFYTYQLQQLRGIDNKYVYEFSRKSKFVDELPKIETNLFDFDYSEEVLHIKNIDYAKKNNIGYRRNKHD